MWHFYGGEPLKMYFLSKQKGLESQILGPDILAGELVQIIVHRHTWFCAEVKDRNGYTLAGCTLFPSFSYTDFEIAEREKLIDEFPEHRNTIDKIYNR
jgi:predicted cupin superfamily sugar epimerase